MRIIDPRLFARIGDGVDVRPSCIEGAGNGLFATRAFSKNEAVTLYDGDIITRKEAWHREILTHMASREGVVVDGLKTRINGRGGGSFANSRWLQRDCNAEIVAYLGLLYIRARKRIEVGDEIFVHYGRRGFVLACGVASKQKASEL